MILGPGLSRSDHGLGPPSREHGGPDESEQHGLEIAARPETARPFGEAAGMAGEIEICLLPKISQSDHGPATRAGTTNSKCLVVFILFLILLPAVVRVTENIGLPCARCDLCG